MGKQILTTGLKISPCKTLEDSYDIEICGARDCVHPVYNAKLEKSILVQEEIRPGQNFYYMLEQFDGRKLMFSEMGVGEIKKRGKKLYLVREICLYFNDGHSTYPVFGDRFFKFNPVESQSVFLSTSAPKTYIEALAQPNSVLCSISAFAPSPVEIEESAVLGRLDGMIQSIDSKELRQILTDGEILSAVSEHMGPFTLLCSSLDLQDNSSRVGSFCFYVKPTDTLPEDPRRGYIMFDAKENCFKGFDGASWRKFEWK